MAQKQPRRKWTAIAVAPPALNDRQWQLSYLAGLIFLAAALLQLISFKDFENNFAAYGFGSPAAWAAVIVMAELWAAAGFFKLKLSPLFRRVSNFLAVAASGFWFFEAVKQVSENINETFTIDNKTTQLGSNFFGGFLNQTPGWWTVIEASLFILFVVYLLDIMSSRTRD